MADTDPNEFTEREKFILSYYRSAELSGSRRWAFYDIVVGLTSIACMAMFVIKDDTAYAFVGYALVAGRLYYLVVEGNRWVRDFRSIFAKYDAKLKFLTEAQKKNSDDVQSSCREGGPPGSHIT
jgi:hypothetical protein